MNELIFIPLVHNHPLIQLFFYIIFKVQVKIALARPFIQKLVQYQGLIELLLLNQNGTFLLVPVNLAEVVFEVEQLIFLLVVL